MWGVVLQPSMLHQGLEGEWHREHRYTLMAAERSVLVQSVRAGNKQTHMHGHYLYALWNSAVEGQLWSGVVERNRGTFGVLSSTGLALCCCHYCTGMCDAPMTQSLTAAALAVAPA